MKSVNTILSVYLFGDACCPKDQTKEQGKTTIPQMLNIRALIHKRQQKVPLEEMQQQMINHKGLGDQRMNMQANYASGHCTSHTAFEVKHIKASYKGGNKKYKIHKIQN